MLKMMNTNTSAWVSYPAPNPWAKMRLFCLPYAGGSGNIFYPWRDKLPKTVELGIIQLPGRATRMSEQPFSQMLPLVKDLTAALQDHLDKPFCLFGHSMGAAVAFETACLLEEQGHHVEHLFVGGRRAPQVSDPDAPTWQLPESEFIAELKRLNGTPAEVLEHAELMQLLLPLLRADFELSETYQYQPVKPLSCGITVFAGEGDDITVADQQAWCEQTEAAFNLHWLPGDHFFLHSCETDFLRLLSTDLSARIPNLF
jgi:medium-chain acyl-[acyl-carrier-protein] hydrolase